MKRTNWMQGLIDAETMGIDKVKAMLKNPRFLLRAPEYVDGFADYVANCNSKSKTASKSDELAALINGMPLADALGLLGYTFVNLCEKYNRDTIEIETQSGARFAYYPAEIPEGEILQ